MYLKGNMQDISLLS